LSGAWSFCASAAASLNISSRSAWILNFVRAAPSRPWRSARR
jgi:hypothetical protein